MGKTIVRVACIDQRLILASTPKIASGGRNEDRVIFEFCSLWTGFEKVAVFYRDPEHVYTMVIDTENSCIIPHEVLKDEGEFFFGVFGVNGDVTRTSEILKYRVEKGAITEAAEIPDPTPELYEQLLALCQPVLAGLDERFAGKADADHTHALADLGAVAKKGDTMTGALTVPDFNVSRKNNYNVLKVFLNDKTTGFLQQDISSNRFKFIQVATDTAFSEQYQLPRPAYGLTEAKVYEILTSKSPVTVAQGGTGANNKFDALLNLGLEIENGVSKLRSSSGDVSLKTCEIFFTELFTSPPSVIVTPTENDAGYMYVTDVTVTGCKINTRTGSVSQPVVHWVAINRHQHTSGIDVE